MTLNREKSEKLFNRIHKVGNMITRLSGVVQNSDSVDESNAYENYLIFREEYSRCISELSKINEAVAALHEEIDNRHSYRFDQKIQADTSETLSAKVRANSFNNGWIKCEDRLPEIGQVVLCQCKNRYGEMFVGIYRDKDRYKDSPYFDWKQNGFPSVIAWQPLPEKFTEF